MRSWIQQVMKFVLVLFSENKRPEEVQFLSNSLLPSFGAKNWEWAKHAVDPASLGRTVRSGSRTFGNSHWNSIMIRMGWIAALQSQAVWLHLLRKGIQGSASSCSSALAGAAILWREVTYSTAVRGGGWATAFALFSLGITDNVFWSTAGRVWRLASSNF